VEAIIIGRGNIFAAGVKTRRPRYGFKEAEIRINMGLWKVLKKWCRLSDALVHDMVICDPKSLSTLIYYNPAFKFNRLASASDNRSYCDIFFNRGKSIL